MGNRDQLKLNRTCPRLCMLHSKVFLTVIRLSRDPMRKLIPVRKCLGNGEHHSMSGSLWNTQLLHKQQQPKKENSNIISRLWHDIFAQWYTSSKRPNSFIRCKSTSRWCTFLTKVQLFDRKT